MKLKPPDSNFADYKLRRRIFMLALNATEPTPRERLECLRRWLEANSPFSSVEKLANLKRALKKQNSDAGCGQAIIEPWREEPEKHDE